MPFFILKVMFLPAQPTQFIPFDAASPFHVRYVRTGIALGLSKAPDDYPTGWTESMRWSSVASAPYAQTR